jgi:hypothetical protein
VKVNGLRQRFKIKKVSERRTGLSFKKWRSLSVIVLLNLGLASGCVTNGKDFRSDLSWIKKSSTTKQNVSSLMGEPYSVGNSGGRETWTYGYYRYKLFGKSNQKELKFYWNPSGTVDDYSFTSSFPSDTGQRDTGSSSDPVGP